MTQCVMGRLHFQEKNHGFGLSVRLSSVISMENFSVLSMTGDFKAHLVKSRPHIFTLMARYKNPRHS